jgi:long-chain fatty acid transport protein
MLRGARTLVGLSTLLASTAWCSGFYFGDNGSKALLQGGAFTAQSDDLTAMQYNPAGLAQQGGFGFLLDAQLINDPASFLRQDVGGPQSIQVNEVTNKGGLFMLPFAGVSYGFPVGGRRLTLSLGVYAPPAVGRMDYGSPDYTKNDTGHYVADPRRFAPQRYSLVKEDIIIAYPTLAAAYEVHPRFMVGASLQLVLSNFSFTQAMFAGDALGINPQKMSNENPDYDALVSIALPGKPTVTGILGVLAKPLDWLAVGASVRPPIPIKASGALTITLSDFFKSTGASVTGNTADLTFTMPLELRVGVRATPIEKLGLNADFVYMGWNSVDALVLTPQNVALVSAGDSKPIGEFRIQKNWKATFSARVGGSYDLLKWLTLHAGALFETSASPDAYFNIDFPNPTRVFITGGVTVHAGPIDVVAGVAGTPTVTTTVQDSKVLRGQTDPTVPAGAAGNGVYTSGGLVMTLGVRGHFDVGPTKTSKELAP